MSRFRAVKSEEEERQSLEGAIPCNTRYSTRWARKIFEEWQTNRGNSSAVNEPTSLTVENKSDIQDLNTRLEDLRAESLNFWLIKFVQEVAKENGEAYPPRTLYCIICGLNRHLAEAKPNGAVNLVDKSDRRLSQFRKALDAEMREGTRAGIATKCKKPVRREITAEEEEVMWRKGVLGSETAECLVNTVYYFNGKMFGLRAAEHRQLRLANIRVEDNYIVFDESVCKTFHGGINDLKYQPRVVRHFCHKVGVKHERCLVEIYEMYLSKVQKLAEKIEGFYFRPNRNGTVFEYESVPIGVNTLNKILPEKLCGKAGLPRKTAHSLRVTCVTNLFQTGVEEKMIRERTGHRSDALFRYEHPTEKQIEKASVALGPVNSDGLGASTSDARESENWFSDETEEFEEVLTQIVREYEGERSSAWFVDDVSDDVLSQIHIPEAAEPSDETRTNTNRKDDNISNVLSNAVFNSCPVNLTINMCEKK